MAAPVSALTRDWQRFQTELVILNGVYLILVTGSAPDVPTAVTLANGIYALAWPDISAG